MAPGMTKDEAKDQALKFAIQKLRDANSVLKDLGHSHLAKDLNMAALYLTVLFIEEKSEQ